jgi:hypothetical protein
MAGFGDSNDIKINVTVDSKQAIEAAKSITQAFQGISKTIGADFKELANISKTLTANNVAEIRKESAAEVAKIRTDNEKKIAELKKELAEFKEAEITKRDQVKATADAKVQALRTIQSINKQAQLTERADIDATRKEEMLKIKESIDAVRAAEATKRKELSTTAAQNIADIKSQTKDAKNAALERIALIKAQSDSAKIQATKDLAAFREAEAGKRAEAKLTLEQIRLDAAKVRRETAQAQVGSGKSDALGALGGGGFARAATSIASVVFIAEKAAQAIGAIGRAITNLAPAAERVVALEGAFNNLQKSVGRDPVASIERLRQATQGLISDTELYQKANQAVLLGVPTKLFEESAEAAVKLGRAMGIDAAFALESLSIGLGRQSRLYLDNLGIVLSATDAYRNFARENNIVGRELTETEKRLAFFNESSKKLREGLANLPPVTDDVGTLFRKLTSTTDNARTGFLKAFNDSQELGRALKDLDILLKSLIPVFIDAGTAVATFIGRLANVKNIPIIEGMANAIGALIKKTDEFLVLSETAKRTRFEEVAVDLKKAEQRLAEAPKGIGYSRFRKELADELSKIKAEYNAIGVELDILDTKRKRQSESQIALRIDTEQISADINDTEALINKVKRDAEESLGLIKIPGLEPDKLQAALPPLDAVFLKIEQGKIKAEEAGLAIQEMIAALSKDIGQANIAAITGQIAKAEQELSKNSASEQLKVDLETLKKRKQLLEENTGLEQAQRDQLLKIIEQRRKAVKDQINEESKRRKGAASEQSRDLKAQQRELEQFTKGIARALERAIPEDVQKKLIDIFNDPKNDAIELADKIKELGNAFLKSGGDIQAFIKEASQLKDLKDKIPDRPLQGTAENTAAIDDYNEKLQRAQEGTINLRDLIFGPQTEGGKKAGGGFFGFDTSEMFGPETQAGLQSAVGAETFAGVEAAIAKAIVDGLKLAITLAFEKFTREDAPQLGEQIGATLGGDIGGIVGRLTGEYIVRNTQDLASTKVRKNIDRYFSDLFDGERLSIVIQGQLTGAIDQATGEAIRSSQPQIARLSDLVFEGFTPFAGNVSFGGENFRSYFDTLSSDIQASFNGVGLALGTLQGVSAEQARLIGIAISNNIGGSLQNLQVLIQQTGESFEDLSNAITESFLNSQLTIEEAYNALLQIQNIFEDGIPGAIGAWEEAIDNFAAKIQDNLPGRYLVDSFRDIGAEAKEANASFQQVVTAWAEKAGLAGQQVQLFFLALRNAGITNLDQLATAGNNVVISVLEAFRQIREGAAATAEDVNKIPIIPDIKPASTPRGGGRNTEADNAKKLREEIQKLLRESTAYEEIVRKITSGELARVAAGAQIIKLQREIESALRRRNDLEKRYSEELAKGSKANKKALADLAADLDKVNERIKKFTEEATKSTREFKAINLEGVIPLIKSANMLGVVATQVGVSLEKASDVLIKGFLQGRLTLKELREEMERTEETLGPGIPNAVGAVTEAFQGLIDAGTQGGQFSVDAFRDIFAEFREKFQKEGSALREAERKQLEENLKAADRAFAQAVGPEASAAARKTLDEAKKALEDFYAAAPAPDLADLRAQLNSVFGETEVNKFFQALGESGLSTFEDFEKAGTDSIVGILQKLQEIGFNFGDTSQAIIDANKELVEAEKVANAGLDPLQEAINLIKGLNEGAAQLPPVFNSTTTAIEGLNGPLASLSAGFDNILEKLSLLSGQTFKNDVVFNVSTVGEPGAQALVDIIFGDGSGTTTAVGGTTSGGNASDSNTSQIARLRKEIQRLQKKTSTRSTRERIASLRKKIVELGG